MSVVTTSLSTATVQRHLCRIAAAASLAAGLCAASAPLMAQTVFNSRASFDATVGTHYDYDFNTDGLVTTLSSSIGDLAGVSTVGHDATGLASGGSLWGSIGGSKDAFTTVKFDFLQPVTGFGFDDLDLNGAEWAIIDVTFTGGGTTRYAVTTFTPFEPVFFGITAAGGLSSVQVFSNNIEAGTDPTLRANLIDNVSIAASVPEPSTWALAGVGLALLAGAARRKSR
jgi:hypothetical protein